MCRREMRRYDYLRAVTLAHQVRKKLAAWGIPAEKTRFTATEFQGRPCLRVFADTRPPGPFAPEIARALARDLGRAVIGSAGDWRYLVILVDALPELPRVIPFPGTQRGVLRIGVNALNQEIAFPLDEEGHILIGGMTRFGKTNLLRGLALQSREQGLETLFCDAGQAKSFPADRRAVLEEAADLLEEVASAPRPCLVLVDEANALVGSLGKKIVAPLNRLAWTGAQYGVHLVIASQDPIRALLGRAPDQALSRLAFKMNNPAAARAMGVPEAWQLPAIKGRFFLVSRDWTGVGQAYLFPDGNSAQTVPSLGGNGLDTGHPCTEDNDKGGV